MIDGKSCPGNENDEEENGRKDGARIASKDGDSLKS